MGYKAGRKKHCYSVLFFKCSPQGGLSEPSHMTQNLTATTMTLYHTYAGSSAPPRNAGAKF